MIDYKKLKILVLDDEKFFTKLITVILMDVGVGAVKVFNDPKDALAALSTFTPNIIISDIEMGDMDGFQFIKNVRKKYPNVDQSAVVFLTVHSGADYIQKAKGLGVSGYLLKPISPEKIISLLGKVYKQLLTSGRL